MKTHKLKPYSNRYVILHSSPFTTFVQYQRQLKKAVINMIQFGNYNYLIVNENIGNNYILTDGEQKIPLSGRYIDKNIHLGDELLVFIYQNQNGVTVATIQRPYACAGDFAFLKVIDKNELGCLMDLGLDTPLLIPLSNQEYPLIVGNEYVIYVYIDHAGKLIASSWLGEHVATDLTDLEEGDKVSILICDISDLVFYAIVNNKYMGILYRNEVYEDLTIGDSVQAYIRKIKPENNKVELSLRQLGFEFIIDSKDTLLDILEENGGILNLGDKSAPEDIHRQLKMSKKAFKQVIGGLYKERLITISDHQIRLVR